MDPAQAAAKAKISATLEKQKTKSDMGSKGSLVTGIKTPAQKDVEDASATGGGQKEKQPEKQKQKATSPPGKHTRLFNFLEEEHHAYAEEL